MEPAVVMRGFEDALAEEMGCEDVNSSNWHAYTRWEWQIMSCFDFHVRLSIKGGRKFELIQHFLLNEECARSVCLCVAYPRGETATLIVDKHPVGHCPYCDYELTR